MLKADPPSSGNTSLQSRRRTRGALDRSLYPPLSGPLDRPTNPRRRAHRLIAWRQVIVWGALVDRPSIPEHESSG